MRLEEIEISPIMHIAVMFALLFLAYVGLSGARSIGRCERVWAEFVAARELGEEKIKVLFDRNLEDFPGKYYCVARFECDGKIHYKMVEKSKRYGYSEGEKREIYVRREKSGIKTEYLVRTKRNYVNQLAAGIYFLFLTMVWAAVIVIDMIK